MVPCLNSALGWVVQCEWRQNSHPWLLHHLSMSCPPLPWLLLQVPAVLCALFDEKQVYVSEQHGEVVPCGHFPWRWTLCGWSLAFKSPQVRRTPQNMCSESAEAGRLVRDTCCELIANLYFFLYFHAYCSKQWPASPV